jgi:hypothetical protein
MSGDLDYDPDQVVTAARDRRPEQYPGRYYSAPGTGGSEYDPAPPKTDGPARLAGDEYRTLRDVYSVDPDEGVAGSPAKRPRRGSRIENG